MPPRAIRKSSEQLSCPTALHLETAAPAIDYQTLLESSLDLICVVCFREGRHRFLYATPSSADLLGWTPDELLRVNPMSVFAAGSMPVIAASIERLLRGDSTTTLVLEAVHRNGGHLWVENKIRILDRAGPAAFRIMVCMRDVTRRVQLEERLEKQARIDGLTEIANRRAFDEVLCRQWKLALRVGSPLSLLMLDVDHFKPFNDTYGHLVGDDCLRSVANAIRDAVLRPDDCVARYGGEEFAVLLPGAGIQGACTVANHLCRAVSALRIPHQGNAEHGAIVTISCGASTASAVDSASVRMPKGLVLAADAALYKAKHRGRNRAACHPLSAIARL